MKELLEELKKIPAEEKIRPPQELQEAYSLLKYIGTDWFSKMTEYFKEEIEKNPVTQVTIQEVFSRLIKKKDIGAVTEVKVDEYGSLITASIGGETWKVSFCWVDNEIKVDDYICYLNFQPQFKQALEKLKEEVKKRIEETRRFMNDVGVFEKLVIKKMEA